jgi:hypothetical protein
MTLNGGNFQINLEAYQYFYFKEYLKYDVDFIGFGLKDPTKEMKKFEKIFGEVAPYKDLRDINLNDYDMILMVNSKMNFMGGVIHPQLPYFFEGLKDFTGTLGYLFNDPSFVLENFPERVRHRFPEQMSQEAVDSFEKRLNTIKIFSGSTDYEQIEPGHSRTVEYWPFVEFSVANYFDGYSRKYGTSEKEFDFVYFGTKKRKTIITKFLKNDIRLSKMIIGFEIKGIKSYEPVSVEELPFLIEKAWFTIVMGDKNHNNFTALRFFQSLNFNTFTFILNEFDIDKKLIKDKELKEIMYVDNLDDVAKKADFVKLNFERLKEKQRAEIENYTKGFEIEKFKIIKLKKSLF